MKTCSTCRPTISRLALVSALVSAGVFASAFSLLLGAVRPTNEVALKVLSGCIALTLAGLASGHAAFQRLKRSEGRLHGRFLAGFGLLSGYAGLFVWSNLAIAVLRDGSFDKPPAGPTAVISGAPAAVITLKNYYSYDYGGLENAEAANFGSPAAAARSAARAAFRLRWHGEDGTVSREWKHDDLIAQYSLPDPPDSRYYAIIPALLFQSKDELERLKGGTASERQIINWVTDPKLWVEALARMDHWTGLARPRGRLLLRFDAGFASGAPTAHANVEAGRINIFLGPLRGQSPYTRESILQTMTHELTHVFQMRSCQRLRPRAMVEGMATYTQSDEPEKFLGTLMNYRQDSMRLPDLAANDDPYRRGLLFFVFLKETQGPIVTKDFIRRIVEDCEPYQIALSKAAGMPSRKLLAEEKAWSEKAWFSPRFRTPHPSAAASLE